MKKILLAILISTFIGVLCGADSVMVDNSGTLAYPTKATFFEKNVRAFQQDFRIFIDTTPSANDNNMVYSTAQGTNYLYYKDQNGNVQRTVASTGQTLSTFKTGFYYYNIKWWTDCEVKVIDKWGNLIYFTSTIALENSQVLKLHPQICDKTPKVFAWLAVGYNSNGGCWGERKELTNFTSSIGASIGSAISGIWIYPSINSTEKRTIPVYTGANQSTNKSVIWGEYIRSVFNNPDNTILVWRQTTSEGETYNGNKLWRPARLEYYGAFKEVF